MDTAIRNMSSMVSKLDTVKESLRKKESIPNMQEELDLLIQTSEQADVLGSQTRTAPAIITQITIESGKIPRGRPAENS